MACSQNTILDVDHIYELEVKLPKILDMKYDVIRKER